MNDKNTGCRGYCGYWKIIGHFVDSEGQPYKKYECSECGFTTVYDKRLTCPSCRTEMAGVR